MFNIFSAGRNSVFGKKFLSLFFAFAIALSSGVLPLVASADITLSVYNDGGLVGTEVLVTPTNGTLTYTMLGTSNTMPTISALASVLADMGTSFASAEASAACSGSETVFASANATVNVDASGNTISVSSSASATCQSGTVPPPHKVWICHVPEGNPENMQSIEVDENSATYHAHLAHGDELGECVTPPPPPPPPPASPMTIVATKIVCDEESKLPNWGLHGGPNITATTATDYVAANPGCVLTPNWEFQWGLSNVTDSGMAHVGLASTAGWNLFVGPTDANGVATAFITNLVSTSKIWVREVLKDGFIPFTFDTTNPNNSNAVSAEMYCHTDVINYDNFDYIASPELGETYYCVAFNAAKSVTPPPPPTNTAPVITVTAPNPTIVTLGGVFTDTGATAFDAEDGVINPNTIAVSGTVNTTVLGTYTLLYNVNDSQGLAAATGTRTVKVLSACSDGIDNDGDGAVDFSDDSGCEDADDNDENNRPVITVLGANPLNITINTTFTDPGANASDIEDCDGLSQADCNTALSLTATGVVDTTVLGTYVISYNAVDSANLAADTETRTVNVVPVVTECNDGIDNDGDGKVDFADDLGCDDANDNDENDPPVITVLGSNPLNVTINTTFTDPGANASDTEDCDDLSHADCNTALSLTALSTVDTSVIGSYTVTYNAVDSKGLVADEQTRIVNVVPVVTECNDGIDNDGDGLIDFPADEGCTSSDDDSENSKPIITLLGSVMMDIVINTTYTDAGANATDAEDCVGKTQAECNTILDLTATGVVDTTVLGTYVIAYNATDTADLAADQKTRTVNVVPAAPTPPPPPPVCTVNCGGGSSTFDYWGCTDSTALNFNSLANKDDGSCTYPTPPPSSGGPINLSITNERIDVSGTSTTVTITWNTNLPSDSRVVYGLDHVAVLGTPPQYGYPLTSATQTAATTSHHVVIEGIPSGISTYFRPVSSDGTRIATGIELERKPVIVGEVLGESTCYYLREYMRLGYDNNPDEVILLQRFLREFEGHSTLKDTGFFGLETDKAVRQFQDKYRTDVLDTWKLPGNTGYVYYTTQKKINEIYCKREFPLTGTQVVEIAAFRELIDRASGLATAPKSNTLAVREAAPQSEMKVVSRAIVPSSSVESDMLANLSVEEVGEIASGKATEKLPGAGRIALTDLLATSPSNGALAATSEKSPDDTTTVSDENNESRRNLAAVAGSVTTRVKDTIVSMFSSLIEGVKNVLNGDDEEEAPLPLR